MLCGGQGELKLHKSHVALQRVSLGRLSRSGELRECSNLSHNVQAFLTDKVSKVAVLLQSVLVCVCVVLFLDLVLPES